MKNFITLCALTLSAGAFAHGLEAPPHLDLEMTSAEYRVHLQKSKSTKKARFELEDPIITRTLKLGTRLSAWISKVNAVRSPENAIRLTSATTRTGIPIDKPNTYSPSIIDEKVTAALAQMPEEMRKIITSTEELPDTIPLEDAEFIKLARLLDRQYQSAARFKSLDQWRAHYIGRAKKDVRGLHYLRANKIGAPELEDLSRLPEEKLPAIKDALIKLCYNTGSTTLNSCQRELDTAVAKGGVDSFYKRYIKNAERLWESFFVIPVNARRSDVEWEGSVARVPFNTPSIPKFIPYLQNNIEDEFKWNGWGLKMVFGTYWNGPVLKFQPGVVPHVNGLGGNEIVMDSNQSIEEYESQWTIRHEFGHVLGLPDCYHEFYDTKLQAYVNYQLDTTDLMCSRAGNMNERIFNELKEAYAK